eukprot:TRINITY_DN761_c0_g1_i3.p1 TRINITY_DN761_c0_g1~~TRINITY_DN761_c0_g1_i3.p1  ORF type:complete len:258 (+),score=90.29 TRINITY_DN761_c0_g1_i3:119-892(+)
MALTFKVKLNDSEIRRFTLNPDHQRFDTVRFIISRLFQTQDFAIRYVDDEGELITIGSDDDLAELIRIAFQFKSKIVHLVLTPAASALPCDCKQQSQPTSTLSAPAASSTPAPVPLAAPVPNSRLEEKTDEDREVKQQQAPAVSALRTDGVHKDRECDSCAVCPLPGVRYTCAVCENFDLCAACYVEHPHTQQHPFLAHEPPVEVVENRAEDSVEASWFRYLDELSSMGFADNSLNLFALQENRGDFAAALNWLVEA